MRSKRQLGIIRSMVTSLGLQDWRETGNFLTGKGGQVMIPNHYNNSVAVVISASIFKNTKRKIYRKEYAKRY